MTHMQLLLVIFSGNREDVLDETYLNKMNKTNNDNIHDVITINLRYIWMDQTHCKAF